MYATMDDLIKYGDELGFDVRSIVKKCDEMRKEHRLHWNGFTQNRAGRLECMIPRFVQDLHPETKKFFDVEMDAKERQKNLEAFLKIYPQFLIVDRYGSTIAIK